jgi:hypothetical protein
MSPLTIAKGLHGARRTVCLRIFGAALCLVCAAAPKMKAVKSRVFAEPACGIMTCSVGRAVSCFVS